MKGELMQKELTCDQVCALLTYYVENKLNNPLKNYVEYHLRICKKCNDKYLKLLKIAKNFNEITKKINDDNVYIQDEHAQKRYEEFRANLSAYVDNELSDDENIKIRKIAISNPIARKDLENFYTFKRLLHSSFDKTKNELKEDYAKNVLEKIYSMHTTNKLDPFYLIMTIFTVIIGLALLGIANFLI